MGGVWPYIVVYTNRSGGHSLICPFQRDCSASPLDVGVSGSNTPIVDDLFGTSLMGMFLWTMGSFYVSSDKWDSTCLFQLRFLYLEKTLISMLIVYSQGSIMHKLGSFLLRFPIGKGSYFLEIPILQIRMHLTVFRWIVVDLGGYM